MNWDDARIFLALCRETTLRGAARVLGVDQATVGRRIAAMEKDLGSTLFLRASDGYLLTASGETALGVARRMESAALELQTRLQGQDDALAGTVRITSTDSITIDFLLPALAQLRLLHPRISVDVDVSTQMLSLPRRQSDLAIRNVKPDNPDLVVRKITSWPVGLFASADYLARHGEPQPETEFAGHQLVAYKPYATSAQGLLLLDEPARQGNIAALLNSSLMLRRAVAAGLGIGEMPVYMGQRENLVRIWPERRRRADYDVWLVTHPDLRATARIRAVGEFLTAAIRHADSGA
ncbi:LysR family transcriptional regulator [Herbaspirillum sp. alder98]|uniref:LysR family transcriptional regulator n=1 Tax=Herbaspirillum sp. alder98 TaxID=2913096 RepID=UPI001CD86D48|nr:LysR family transcriptional regulator [Herbaspirillum sp. alder98]MCA1325566.1 LysR family transcriptional regulator [Herbaspirillum sp. alder98]